MICQVYDDFQSFCEQIFLLFLTTMLRKLTQPEIDNLLFTSFVRVEKRKSTQSKHFSFDVGLIIFICTGYIMNLIFFSHKPFIDLTNVLSL